MAWRPVAVRARRRSAQRWLRIRVGGVGGAPPVPPSDVLGGTDGHDPTMMMRAHDSEVIASSVDDRKGLWS